jgi:hypothetical protein
MYFKFFNKASDNEIFKSIFKNIFNEYFENNKLRDIFFNITKNRVEASKVE